MEFPAHLDFLVDIITYVRQQAESFGIDHKTIYKIELACEEAVVNIISYAYSGEEGTVVIQCEKQPDTFKVTLRDRGVAFNPLESILHPEPNMPITMRRVGGLGIFLMSRTANKASYQRNENENVLHLVFHIGHG
ncbi:MAG: ATP-binding protein [Chlamydiales bacterium]